MPEFERNAAPSAGDGRRRFLEMMATMVRDSGGWESEEFLRFPAVVGVMAAPRAGEDGAEAAQLGGVLVMSPLGMILLRAEGGGADLGAVLQEIFAAGGGPEGAPPASKASIGAMRTVERPVAAAAAAEEEIGEEADTEECSVCLEGLWSAEEGEKGAEPVVKEMPCRHRYHVGCIEKWLRLHGSCPICRYRMPEEEAAGGKKGAEQQVGETPATVDGEVDRQQHQAQQDQGMQEID